MPQYTVTLSGAQEKALLHVALDAQAWIDNVVHTRCNAAIKEISEGEIERKLNAGETVSGTPEEIVMAANIMTRAEIQAEVESQMPVPQNPA